jgi:hypothetical protein
MTIEESAKSLIRAVTAAWCEDTSPDKLIEVITGSLRALLYTESERAAGVCHTERNKARAIGAWVAQFRSGCDCCHDEILRTSPGKGGK